MPVAFFFLQHSHFDPSFFPFLVTPIYIRRNNHIYISIKKRNRQAGKQGEGKRRRRW